MQQPFFEKEVSLIEDLVIAVDAMGGDNGPQEVVKGALAAMSDNRLSISLVGREADINKVLGNAYDKSRLTVVNASEVIAMDEVPTAAIKSKKDSSMAVGLRMVKEGRAHAFVSAGNTGALLAGATIIVGRIKGVLRPALAVLLPNEKGFSFLIDAGANMDAKPEYLVQFAKMGSIYMENVIGIKSPRVALVGIGAEKEKGNGLTKEAYELLEGSCLNFTGNIEARDIAFGGADVLVCDAFVGNVILKYSEGFSKALFNMLKKELMSTTRSKIGAFLSKDAFASFKRGFDYSEVGGAPFLGLKSLVVKAHGSSDAKAISAAIGQCAVFIENDIAAKIEQQI